HFSEEVHMSTRVSAHASLIKRLRLHLKTEGYSPSIQRSYPTLAGHFLDYCENKHLSPDAVRSAHVTQFFRRRYRLFCRRQGCRAVGAVQGRTACSRRSETLRRRRASLRRRGIDGTGRKRRCSISSWPSTILSSEIVGWPKGERCRGTSKTSSKPISSAVCLSTDFFGSSATPVRRRS